MEEATVTQETPTHLDLSDCLEAMAMATTLKYKIMPLSKCRSNRNNPNPEVDINISNFN